MKDVRVVKFQITFFADSGVDRDGWSFVFYWGGKDNCEKSKDVFTLKDFKKKNLKEWFKLCWEENLESAADQNGGWENIGEYGETWIVTFPENDIPDFAFVGTSGFAEAVYHHIAEYLNG